MFSLLRLSSSTPLTVTLLFSLIALFFFFLSLRSPDFLTNRQAHRLYFLKPLFCHGLKALLALLNHRLTRVDPQLHHPNQYPEPLIRNKSFWA